MRDVYRGLIIGLSVGLCVALFVSVDAYGFVSVRSLMIVAVLGVLSIPMLYYHCAMQYMRAVRTARDEQRRADIRARRRRIAAARHLRPVGKDRRGD